MPFVFLLLNILCLFIVFPIASLWRYDYFFVLHPKGNYGAVPFSLLAEDDNVWIAQSVPLNTYESPMRHVFRKFDYVARPAGPAVVAELNKAMAVLVKHEMVMEQHSATVAGMRSKIEAMDGRLNVIEREMPGLIEVRADIRKVFWLVVSAVVMAAAGLAAVVMSEKK